MQAAEVAVMVHQMFPLGMRNRSRATTDSGPGSAGASASGLSSAGGEAVGEVTGVVGSDVTAGPASRPASTTTASTRNVRTRTTSMARKVRRPGVSRGGRSP